MIHLGQRKLLLTEVQFLTKYCDKAQNIIYVGAAPGHHITYLSELFPNNIFHLYDPRNFAIKPTNNFILISDIRQDITTSMTDKDKDKIIIEDMNLQRSWIEKLNPVVSLLKFRLPTNCDDYEYLDGTIVNQPWTPESTLETRLIVDEIKYKIYDTIKYQKNMEDFKKNRQVYMFNHKVPLKKVPGLDHCYDCCLEINIWKEYLEKYYEISNTNITNHMRRTSTLLKKYLTKNAHGKMRIKL